MADLGSERGPSDPLAQVSHGSTDTESCPHSHLEPVPSADPPHSLQIPTTSDLLRFLLPPFLRFALSHYSHLTPEPLTFPFYFLISSTPLKPRLLIASDALTMQLLLCFSSDLAICQCLWILKLSSFSFHLKFSLHKAGDWKSAF